MLAPVTGFVPVRSFEQGGEGIPVPHYKGVFKDETIYVFAKGAAREAVDWLRARGPGVALVAVMDGIEREVARNE